MGKKKKPSATPQVAMKLPSAFSLFRPSIEALRVNVGTVVGLMLSPLLATLPFLVVLIVVAGILASKSASPNGAIVATSIILLLYAAFIILSVFVAVGLIIATLRCTDNKKIGYLDSLRIGRHYFWRYLGLCICMGLAVVVGLVLLIVPGIFMLRRFFLAPYYLVDRNMSIFEAMKQCAADSKGSEGIWGLLGIGLIIGLIAAIPAAGWIIAFIIGILYICGPAVRYRQILTDVATQTAKAKNDKK